jgi:formate hydrogenlyase transcriptional activator
MSSALPEISKANAQIILEVAKAIGAHLEMPEVLAALNETLEPIIHFDAVGVSVVDGDFLKPYSAHIEGFPREPGESLASLIKRFSPNIDNSLKHDVCDHPVSEMFALPKPYVATDLKTQRRFAYDEICFSNGFRSYISLPLLNNGGELFGDLIFLSKGAGSYAREQIDLLQSIAEIVSIAVANALAYEEIKRLKEQLQLENRALQEEIVQRSIYEEIVGSSSSLQKVVTAIEKVAPTDSTVLITGETGTGKELVAHAIHRRSDRSDRALVKVNCAALPSELIASELFGHEKGAFTGAMQQRIGRFEAANGGTIFLDEIAELSPEVQVALLRVLQEREFERVGGNRTIKTDVRVIAATNKDLEREVNDGRFRMDLFYRLNVFPIQVPPLRERGNDIPVLVDYFATRLAARTGKKISQIEKRSLETMQQYSWPGNIRELQNVIERCVILAEGGVLRLEPGMLQSKVKTATDTVSNEAINGGHDRKTEIEAVLRETHGRVYGPGGAATRLGLPASTLESRIRALKINKHQFK